MARLTQKELEELIKANVIDEATASKITSFYDSQKAGSTGRLNVALGILGSLLAGVGIVLLVAHNWDQLGRGAKTFLSFLPLLIGQILCTYVLLKKKGNVAWRESGATILLFAVGASISLVSQVYHIEGSLSGFVLTWLVLVIPLVYIMNSSAVALLCIAGATWHACLVGYDDFSRQLPYAYLAVVIIMMPLYYRYYKKDPGNNFFHLMNWTFVISLAIVLGCFGEFAYKLYGWLFVAYLSLFSLYYLYGKLPRWHGRPRWTNPYRIVGLIGILFILFIWSFDFLWEDVMGAKSPFANKNFYIAVALMIPSILLLIGNKAWRTIQNIDPTGLSIILFILLMFLPGSLINLALLAMNLWILLIAIYFINRGSLMNHLGILNFGLLIVLVLALCRFFDDRIPFVWRGFFFLATGISFFAANYFLLKKRKKTITREV